MRKLWSYDNAKAGYDTNPLVVDGKVIIPNRDGAVYAIGAHGTANQGQLIWKYQSGGPIHLSPAYKDGTVFFAANDNYAYALNASNRRTDLEISQTSWGRISLLVAGNISR